MKDLTTNISDSRTGVSDVKSFIDGMRQSRDTKMQEMNRLKTTLKEQNERLLIVTQEKAQVRIGHDYIIPCDLSFSFRF